MPEHYTKNTLEYTAWCSRCGRMTQHRVDSGRRGPCIDPDHPQPGATRKERKRAADREHSRQNPSLFGGDK